MKTIHKFPLATTDLQVIYAPTTFKPLCVQVQNDRITLWAEVDTDQPNTEWDIAIVGTGHNMYATYTNYIGTVQLDGLVWHIYY